MKKRLSNYLVILETVKKDSSLLGTFDLQEMIVQIHFFQHERLIHLLVTLFFGILTFLCVLYISLFPSIALFALNVLFFILLVFYLRHYYFLENNIQKLYSFYDEIKKLKNEMHF